MTFKEFPKALYRKGEYLKVEDAADEKEKRKAGWTDWRTDFESMNPPAEVVLGTVNLPPIPAKQTVDPKRPTLSVAK